MKRAKETLPELTRLYLRACEILKVFDAKNKAGTQKDAGVSPSSDSQSAPDFQQQQKSSFTKYGD
jgi:hypothetical protein